MVLSRRSQNPVVIQGTRGGTRLLTVTVLEIDGAEVILNLDLDAEIPADPSQAPERIHDECRPESRVDAPYGGERMRLTARGGTRAMEKQCVR
jgi:hypothetical protein